MTYGNVETAPRVVSNFFNYDDRGYKDYSNAKQFKPWTEVCHGSKLCAYCKGLGK